MCWWEGQRKASASQTYGTFRFCRYYSMFLFSNGSVAPPNPYPEAEVRCFLRNTSFSRNQLGQILQIYFCVTKFWNQFATILYFFCQNSPIMSHNQCHLHASPHFPSSLHDSAERFWLKILTYRPKIAGGSWYFTPGCFSVICRSLTEFF